MESLSNIYSEIKSRLTSPFFGSFIISWLIFNWPIVIVLIFYSQKQLRLEHQTNYIGYIKSQYSWQNCFLWPLISTSIYILGYPYVKNWISVYIEKRKIQGEAKILKMSTTEGYVSIAKHQLLQSELNKKFAQLTTFYNEQTEIEKKYLEQEVKIAEMENQLATSKTQIETAKNRNEISISDRIYTFQIIGKLQVKSFSDNSGINIMSLSNWEFLDYTTLYVHDEFRYDGSGLNTPMKASQYRIFNLAITTNDELLMNFEDLRSPVTRYSILLKRVSSIQFEGFVNEQFAFTMTKIL